MRCKIAIDDWLRYTTSAVALLSQCMLVAVFVLCVVIWRRRSVFCRFGWSALGSSTVRCHSRTLLKVATALILVGFQRTALVVVGFG